MNGRIFYYGKKGDRNRRRLVRNRRRRSRKKSGADVTIVEKTDLMLGLGNVGGIMRNNGRFTAAEENIALGASELFELTDKYSRHRNIDFPGHSHASLYDVVKVEPAVRRLLKEMGIDVRTTARAVDAEYENGASGKYIGSITLFDGTKLSGDVFIETTGSTGPMGNCLTYGNGCSMYRIPGDARIFPLQMFPYLRLHFLLNPQRYFCEIRRIITGAVQRQNIKWRRKESLSLSRFRK